VSEAVAEAEIGRLQALVGDDPGAAAFPALAEALRRTGRAKDAERVARAGLERRPDTVAGRVALGLALLDLGRETEARAELERVLERAPGHPLAARAAGAWTPPPPTPAYGALEAIGEGEIDDAFELARPDDEPASPEEAVTTALHLAELEGPEEAEPLEAAETELPVSTRTVAELLERQGHAEDAERMRASLDDADPERERVLATLERWLDNLRRRRS
jgi:tetratricopeptide (TPR) repeat protein